MSLTILGKSDHTTLWVDVDGDTFALTTRDIANASRVAVERGTAAIAGHEFDESDCIELAHAIRRGNYLADCRWCEQPAPFPLDGDWVCDSHLAGYGLAEDESQEAS